MTDFERTVDLLKAISPSELVNRGIVSTAPNHKAGSLKGYICPLCNSGGRGGTGAAEFDSNNRLYCHACENADNGGHKLSPIDLFARARNMQHDNFVDVVKAMASEFTIDLAEGKSSRQRANSSPPKPTTDSRELELIRQDLNTSDESLKQFVESQGGSWRGLPVEILLRFGCRYFEKWTPPKSRAKNTFATPTPRILIPSSDDFYLARFVGNLDDYDEPTRKIVDEYKKQNAGSPSLFNRGRLDSDMVIAVEGAVDAMSLEFVGYPAVATNAAGKYDLLVAAIAEKEKKPSVVILFDSDDTGRKKAPQLHDELLKIGCPAVIRFLSEVDSKIDCNDILVNDGVDALRERVNSLLADVDADFHAAQTDIDKIQARADVAELFQGDGSDLDYARRFEKFFGSEIRWLTDSERWLLYQRNSDGGAIWINGGDKNSCLLPRVREMADVMTAHAVTTDERGLADKLKRTRKNLSSITMLKSLDSILITAEDIDRHGELLNVRNGVIDLTTGKLLQASPELLLTQTAAAVFNPKEEDDTFAEFLKSVLPDDATRAAVSRFLGYSMTADVSAEKFLLVSGTGANGKGTLFLTLRTLMKDYATELPVDAVLENHGRNADTNGRATPELNGLAKRRLGVIDELPRNGRVDVAKLKRLTGGDYLPLRRLHCEYNEIAPTHKLIMCGNYRPSLDDTRDTAFLRRLIAVKFEQDFSKNPDETLKKKLLADSALSGALNILVAAAVDWYRDGLLAPSTLMKRARREYLEENDFVGAFLAENYIFDDKLSTPRKDLLKRLRDACAECSRYRDNDLANMVAKVEGVTCQKEHNKFVFRGIGLATNGQQGEIDFDKEIVSSADFCPPSD